MRTKNTLQRLESEHKHREDDILKRHLTVDEKMPVLCREVRRHLRAMIRHHDQIERERLATLKSELDSMCQHIRVENKRRAAEARELRREIAAYIRDTAKS